MEKRQKIRQEARLRNRLKKRRQKRIATAISAIILSVCFIFVISTVFNKDKEQASANLNDSIKEEKTPTVPKYEIKTEKEFENQVTDGEADRTSSSKDIDYALSRLTSEGYSDKLVEFLSVDKEAKIYTRSTTDSEKLTTLLAPRTIETFGMENGWVKAKFDSSFGYVKESELKKIEDKNLYKIFDGILYVNKEYSVDETYIGRFDNSAESALKSMTEALERNGLKVQVGSKYRSYKEELKLFNEASNKISYKPEAGHSEFQTGTAVELYPKGTDPRIANNLASTPEGKWLYDNAHKYGFVLRFPEGKENSTGYVFQQGIFKYVGIEAAKEIYETGITFDEYIKK